MADNILVTPGSGATIAADDIGGVLYQRVKLTLGADGSATDIGLGQQAMAASVPVVIASDQSVIPINDNGGSLTVDGSVGLNAGTNVIGYVRILRQYSDNTTLVPSATVTVNGNSSDLSVALYNSITCFLDVTAYSGTNPTLDVYAKSKDPISANYITIGQYPQVTGIGTWQLAIDGSVLGSDIRFEWVLGGTDPSFTFSIGIVLKG